MIEAAVIAMLLTADAPVKSEPWKRHTIDDSSRGADGVRLGDANGDGLMDIATGWEEGGIVRVYLNPGPRKSKDKWPAVTVGKAKNVEDAVFVDLDGDGALDVVSSCEGGTRTIFVHWAPPEKGRYLDPTAWKTEPIPATLGKQMWMYCLPMQIDGERGIDLVVGSKGKGAAVGWLESPDDPRQLDQWKYHKILDAGWVMSIEAAEQKNKTYVLVSDRKGDTRGVYRFHTTDGSVWAKDKLNKTDAEFMFLAHTIDSRGFIGEVAWATRNGEIRTHWIREVSHNPPGLDVRKHHWMESIIPNPFGVPHGKAVAIGDIDGDGMNDYVHTTNTGGNRSAPGVAWIRVSKGPGKDEIVFEPRSISGPQGVKFDRIELLDLDGDGDLDVITCEERDNLGVIWYENPTK